MTRRPSPQEARDVLDMAVLRDLSRDGGFGRYETFLTLSIIGDGAIITRDLARAICRDLTDRGLACYQRGLFTDDGVPAGAGYGITRKGFRYLAALEEVYAEPGP